MLFAGEFHMCVECRCATQHITFSSNPPMAQSQLHHQHQLHQQQQPQLDQPQLDQQHQHQQQPQRQVAVHAPMHFQLAVECLVLSVWDDERSKLLGVRAGPEAKHCSELCCLYWDGLTATCLKAPLTGDACCSAITAKRGHLVSIFSYLQLDMQ